MIRRSIRSLSLAFVAALLAAGSASATTYYIAANGSDSNNGASKSSPWLHAPGMTGCTGTCNSTNPQPGDSFIFRGGDTWHYGNSAATPFVGGTSPHWNWNWAGSSANCQLDASAGAVIKTSCIYIGVDQTWFSGGSWTRPIMSGDNPLNTNYVSSCTFNENGNNFLFLSKGYVVFDNFEWTAWCWNGNPNSGVISMFANNQQVTNNYFHGWSATSGFTDQFLMIGGNNTPVVNIIDHNVFDGSDALFGGAGSSKASGKAVGAGTEIAYNIFWQVSNGAVVGGYTNNVHDNIFYYLIEPSDPGGTHGNIVEQLSEPPSTSPSTYFFNNLMYLNGEGEGINVYADASAGGAIYVFNNISYWYRPSAYDPPVNSSNSGDCFLWEDTGGVGATQTVNFFNNTIDAPCAANLKNITITQNFTNNQIIGMSPNNISGFASPTINEIGGEIFQAEATANGQGYATTNNYAPTSTSGATVGAGVNIISTCNSIPNSIARTACQNAYAGVTYNQANHTAVNNIATARGSVWDSGAYQFNSSSQVNPPTNLIATVQ